MAANLKDKETAGAAADPPTKLQLYSYWRSSSSHRVRIVLNLKGLDYEYRAVNLLENKQSEPDFEKLNPAKCVPVLVDGDIVVADSLAIILFLDDKYPQHRLVPCDDLWKKALNIQASCIVGSSIQPLQNISVLNFMEKKFDSDAKLAWAQDHIGKGFTALEKLLKGSAGKFATGDEVQLADVFLAPQIYAGIARFKIDMSHYPTLARLHEAYTKHPAFQAALPERQPDAPSSF